MHSVQLERFWLFHFISTVPDFFQVFQLALFMTVSLHDECILNCIVKHSASTKLLWLCCIICIHDHTSQLDWHCDHVYTYRRNCFTAVIQDNLVSRHLLLKTEDSVEAEFYCLHALAVSNYCIQLPEKMLGLSSTVLHTPSPYHAMVGFM